MSDLQQGAGPKGWPTYRANRGDFAAAVLECSDALASMAVTDGANVGDATNAAVHELLHVACVIACENARNNLGRDPRLEQWMAVAEEIFDRCIKATTLPTEGGE